MLGNLSASSSKDKWQSFERFYVNPQSWVMSGPVLRIKKMVCSLNIDLGVPCPWTAYNGSQLTVPDGSSGPIGATQLSSASYLKFGRFTGSLA